jgi:hypothetical protein
VAPTGARRWCALALGAVVVILSGVAVASPAGAAGDPALDRLIVANPLPAWSPLPGAQLQSLVSYEDRAGSAVAGSATSAAEGWQGPGPGQRLIVAMVRFAANVPEPVRNAREAVIAACASATGNAPTSVHAYGAVPGSEVATCAGTGADGTTLTATNVAWARGNVLVILIATGLATSEAESVAVTQDAAIPQTGVRESSSDTGTVVVVGVAAVVAGIGLGLGLTVRARRRRTATVAMVPVGPAAPGGQWAPDPSGRHELRYWSGTQWTEHVTAHGVQSTDPLSSPPAAPPAAPGTGAVDIGTVSDDGEFFWNGTAWVPTRSRDGRMRWNGTQWMDDPD